MRKLSELKKEIKKDVNDFLNCLENNKSLLHDNIFVNFSGFVRVRNLSQQKHDWINKNLRNTHNQTEFVNNLKNFIK